MIAPAWLAGSGRRAHSLHLEGRAAARLEPRVAGWVKLAVNIEIADNDECI